MYSKVSDCTYQVTFQLINLLISFFILLYIDG
jgi:hypothetical protein